MISVKNPVTKIRTNVKSECIKTFLALFGRAQRNKYSICQMHIEE